MKPVSQFTPAQLAVRERQLVERRIVKAALDIFLEAGFRISVHDGEEVTLSKSRVRKDIVKAMFTTDEDSLFLYKPDGGARYGWIHFIYGNDGHDVICDYSCNLEELVEPVIALADKIAEAA